MQVQNLDIGTFSFLGCAGKNVGADLLSPLLAYFFRCRYLGQLGRHQLVWLLS